MAYSEPASLFAGVSWVVTTAERVIDDLDHSPSHYSPDPRMIFSGIFVSCLIEVRSARYGSCWMLTMVVDRWRRRISIKSMRQSRHSGADIVRA